MIEIAGRKIGLGQPVFIIAELSANARTLDEARELIRQAKYAGADAVKTQCYRPESMTIDCDNEHFRINSGPWAGSSLWELYAKAATPWEWQPQLKRYAESFGLVWFSTAYDKEGVDFLESLNVSCHKVASFEITDTNLIHQMSLTRKPLIISTGMATDAEIWEALESIRGKGNAIGARGVILLKCTSAYPAPIDSFDLRSISVLSHRYNVIPGLSDHSLSIVPPVAAVALGACVIEKHLSLSRDNGGPDAGFSLEPQEFKAMVEAVRDCEAALGSVRFGPTESEKAQLPFRRSLFVVEDMRDGDVFSEGNVRSIRPAAGLPPGQLDNVLGKRAARDIERGTPLSWEMITG